MSLGTVVFLTGAAMLTASAAMVVACLRLHAATPYLLATYIVAWAEIVVLCGLLSLPHALTRTSLLGGLAVTALASLVVRRRLGRPPPPLTRAHGRWLRDQLRDPVLALLAVAVVAGYLYAGALAFLTPQNDGDPLVYELTRATVFAAALVGARARLVTFLGPLVVACVPLAAWVAGTLLAGGLRRAWDAAGKPETAAEMRDWQLPTAANAYASWYGPIAVVATAAILAASVVLARRTTLPWAVVALAATPVAALAVVAASLDYDLSRGRFLIGAVAAGAAVWGSYCASAGSPPRSQ